MNGRYYDPATGQFLTVDPMVDLTEVPYSYAGGDPVDATDPTGAITNYHPDQRFISWMEVEENTCSSTGAWCFVNGQCQIGYGHDASGSSPCYAGSFTEGGTQFRTPLSDDQQTQLLVSDLNVIAAVIPQRLLRRLNQHQADALVSFIYNLGAGYFESGHTLYDYLIHGGRNPKTILGDFELYRQPASLPGVLNRRYDEAEIFLRGNYTHAPAPSTASRSLTSALEC